MCMDKDNTKGVMSRLINGFGVLILIGTKKEGTIIKWGYKVLKSDEEWRNYRNLIREGT